MRDDEIATKRLSDWKPERDIKLQKAFGKFVEEAGELLEASFYFFNSTVLKHVTSFENEIADCQAFIDVIERASSERIKTFSLDVNDISKYFGDYNGGHSTAILSLLSGNIGSALSIVGRCQIQGLDKNDPEHHTPNVVTLTNALSKLKVCLSCVIVSVNLNKDRIEKRKLAKIESKLPWVMGTATDLKPDYVVLDKDLHPVNSNLMLKKARSPDSTPFEVIITHWSDDPLSPYDVCFSQIINGTAVSEIWRASHYYSVEKVLGYESEEKETSFV